MDHQYIIEQLGQDLHTFKALLPLDLSEQLYRWKPTPDKWCLLEVVCHLYDEEREDFKARVRHVLETPGEPMTPINPVAWVDERRYTEQSFKKMAGRFLQEREKSIAWLNSLTNPSWKNAYQHPQLGPITAEKFLANWLAHDYIHFRQITRLKYQYHREQSGENLDYAGTW